MDTQTQTDIIHQKIYDFLLYIYPLLAKYPKFEKFSLQTATRNAILEMLQEVINRRYAGKTNRRGKGKKIAEYGAAAYLRPLAGLIAGGCWGVGVQVGARAVPCIGCPWYVGAGVGGRGACDLVKTLQTQSSTEYWQGLIKG
jgi:hypothetical protein